MTRPSSGSSRSVSMASISPGWPRAGSWPRTAGPGGSRCTRGCSSTTAMASSPPKTSCTAMPCGVIPITRAAKTRPTWAIKMASARSSGSRWSTITRSSCTARSCASSGRFITRAPRPWSSSARRSGTKKARWRMSGTRPYIYKERKPDRYVLYERAPTPHWKWGTVDWKELQMTWTIEEPTRLAQFLAGETHLTELNKDLVDEAVNKGHKLIRSRQVAQQIVLVFGGLNFGTEDKQTKRYTEDGGTTGKLDLSVPWTKKEVRQAINKAINREELLRVLYKGRATYTYVAGYYPGLPGWDPTWEKRFPEMYGYDPKAAKRLLAQAGYPKGFKMKAWLYPFAGAPEFIPLIEAVQVQLREVGIELEFEEADLVATVLPKTRKRENHQYIRPGVPSKKAVEAQISLFNAGKGTAHWFETDELYKMWEDLLQMSDPKEADAQLRKIGN